MEYGVTSLVWAGSMEKAITKYCAGVNGVFRTSRHYSALPSLSAQRAISSLLGRVMSVTLRTVSAPATGKPAGSSKPT